MARSSIAALRPARRLSLELQWHVPIDDENTMFHYVRFKHDGVPMDEVRNDIRHRLSAPKFAKELPTWR